MLQASETCLPEPHSAIKTDCSRGAAARRCRAYRRGRPANWKAEATIRRWGPLLGLAAGSSAREEGGNASTDGPRFPAGPAP